MIVCGRSSSLVVARRRSSSLVVARRRSSNDCGRRSSSLVVARRRLWSLVVARRRSSSFVVARRCCDSGSTNPTKDAREITDHHVLRMFRKCRMLNLRFLRDSYVTRKRRRIEIIKFQAFGGLSGRFGDHFGSIWGTFSAHFGGPERTWQHIPYKKRFGFSRSRFWDRKMSKNNIFGPPKIPKSEPEWYQQR